MRIVAAVLLVLLLVPTWSGDERLPLWDGVPTVVARRVALDASDPSRTRLGPLTYLGGLELSSRNWAFGGFSALAVRDGRVLLLSDGGLTIDFRLNDAMRASDYRIGALPAGPATGWSKRDRDSESLAVDPATGDLLVGFERYNGIWRYNGTLTRSRRARAPREMRGWPKNGGPEAMAPLPGGRFAVFSEDADARGGGKRALVFDRDPTDAAAKAYRFRFHPPAGYLPTDAAMLPDGRLLVLTRAVSLESGFTARLLLVDPAAIGPARDVAGRVLATFAYPVLHDNFEGLAVTQDRSGTIVWLLSDDNGPSLFQRTLLLKFRLNLTPAHAESRPGR